MLSLSEREQRRQIACAVHHRDDSNVLFSRSVDHAVFPHDDLTVGTHRKLRQDPARKWVSRQPARGISDLPTDATGSAGSIFPYVGDDITEIRECLC